MLVRSFRKNSLKLSWPMGILPVSFVSAAPRKITAATVKVACMDTDERTTTLLATAESIKIPETIKLASV